MQGNKHYERNMIRTRQDALDFGQKIMNEYGVKTNY
jgi:hypothetical protein